MQVTINLSTISIYTETKSQLSIITEESLIMKTGKPLKTLKTQAQPRSAKSQSAKAGIKIRSGLRAGYHHMGFTDMY
jgi:hypothetical protein